MTQIDILAFGAHSDDVELGVGGTLLKMKNRGLKTGIISLTQGEMNSRTTPKIIQKESDKAAEELKVDISERLNLGDTKISDSYENRLKIAKVIRKYRPKIVLAPYYVDRHLDHSTTGKLIKNSNIFCRLKKLESKLPPHGPSQFLFYLLQVKNCVPPTLVVDISDVYKKKKKAISCYQSQFATNADEQGVIPIGIGDYLFHIESRDRYYGSLINVKYGEAFVSEEPLNISDFNSLV